MLTTVHLVCGAAIGKATGYWWLTVPFSFISHYILDALPQYNQKPVGGYLKGGFKGSNKRDLIFKSIEPIIGVGIVGYLVMISEIRVAPLIVLGAFFGWLPDLLVFIKWKYNIELRFKILEKIEQKFHKHTSFLLGSLLQLAILTLVLVYLFL